MLAASMLFAGAGTLAGCSGGQLAYNPAVPGNPGAGKKLIVSYGCGSCHVIPGIYQARGLVGPPLYFWGRRTLIAGELPNVPANLVRWIMNPPAIEPGTAMPNLGVSRQQAQDIAAYLDRLN